MKRVDRINGKRDGQKKFKKNKWTENEGYKEDRRMNREFEGFIIRVERIRNGQREWSLQEWTERMKNKKNVKDE